MDLGGTLWCHLGRLMQRSQEELDPSLRVTTKSDVDESYVVLGPMGLDVIADIEQGLVECLLVDEQKGDQQTSESSIAIEDRLDRLKLHVNQSHLYVLGISTKKVVRTVFFKKSSRRKWNLHDSVPCRANNAPRC